MTATLHFTSSDSFREHDPRAVEHVEVEIEEYIEATYQSLRTGPDGREIAYYLDGAWELPTGARFSDWAVKVA